MMSRRPSSRRRGYEEEDFSSVSLEEENSQEEENFPVQNQKPFTHNNNDDKSVTDLPDESQSLLKPVNEPEYEGKADFLSSVSNLTNTILGAGMLGMPLAVSKCGIIFGCIFLVLGALASAFGLYLLAVASTRTKKGTSNYFSVALITYPRAAIAIDIAVALKCFGVATSYLVVIGDLMPDAMNTILVKENTSLFLSRNFWIPIAMIFVTPLGLLKHMNSLRFTSWAALGTVIYFLAIVLYFFFTIPRSEVGPIEIIPRDYNLFSTIPIFIFGFTCHQNLFAIYNEIKADNKVAERKKINHVIALSITIAFFVYVLVSFLGYLTFGNKVTSNLIKNYPDDDVVVFIARISISLLVLFSHPLQVHPCRASLKNILFYFFPNAENFDQYLRVGISLFICGLSFLIAFLLDDLGLIFAVVGATGSVTLCYILPAAFYIKLKENEPWNFVKIMSFALLVGGVLLMVNSLVFIFLNEFYFKSSAELV